MVKIDPHAARLRHARYYVDLVEQAQYGLYLEGEQLEGLALFDRERQQIDAAWQWAQVQSTAEEIDILLNEFADATAIIGKLRYDMQRERIPQIEAQITAACRLEDKRAESLALNNLQPHRRRTSVAERAPAAMASKSETCH